MKTILYLASELNPRKAKPARCNDLYKVIDKHLSTHKAKSYFTLQKWDQPTGDEVLEKIGECPAYIHYCGHGDENGDIQLKTEEGQIQPLKSYLLENSLKDNFNLECVLLGSCNSDKLVDQLKLLADYSIGFTKSPSAKFVIGFYDAFYAHLAKHGSPFKAFLVARDKLIAKRTKTAGAQAILRSKHNYIMELLALNEQSALLRSNVSDRDASISTALNKLATLEGEARSVFEQLLLEHPFAEDVFWFYSYKEKLAHDIAKQIMEGEEEDDIDFFSQRLFMAFEVLEKILIAYEQKELSRGSLSKIGKGMPREQTIMAFKKLEKNEIFKSRPQGFRDLLSESIKYCLKELTMA
ncbi:MAG: hypothetical protein DYG98_14045 [Haliscomenobacteraceae bacterium CHB4]|nr:hypothetical protein [Saprospiraceae bacterium]MCE7924170.1 hypothetical protein [Haliscomenobacteraceae bacterium CHB4]